MLSWFRIGARIDVQTERPLLEPLEGRRLLSVSLLGSATWDRDGGDNGAARDARRAGRTIEELSPLLDVDNDFTGELFVRRQTGGITERVRGADLDITDIDDDTFAGVLRVDGLGRFNVNGRIGEDRLVDVRFDDAVGRLVGRIGPFGDLIRTRFFLREGSEVIRGDLRLASDAVVDTGMDLFDDDFDLFDERFDLLEEQFGGRFGFRGDQFGFFDTSAGFIRLSESNIAFFFGDRFDQDGVLGTFDQQFGFLDERLGFVPIDTRLGIDPFIVPTEIGPIVDVPRIAGRIDPFDPFGFFDTTLDPFNRSIMGNRFVPATDVLDPNVTGVLDPNVVGVLDPNVTGVLEPDVTGVLDPNVTGVLTPDVVGFQPSIDQGFNFGVTDFSTNFGVTDFSTVGPARLI